jgi:rfaE bifunctional protein nucleotidyltransferase chain/domain
MDKIITPNQAADVAKKRHKEGKRIVLVGGCFDILHIGHITFLEKAKQEGDILFILLEHDENIKKMKGSARPINTQKDRAIILASLELTDYIILLPPIDEDRVYDNLVFQIKPDIIATTKGDTSRHHKERSAQLVHAKIIDVTKQINDQSTTRLVKLMNEVL